MAKWLYDPVESALAGTVRFRRPYPRQDWIEDMTWNDFPIAAMQHVTEADRVFSIPAENWGAKENEFFRAMMEGLDNANL